MTLQHVKDEMKFIFCFDYYNMCKINTFFLMDVNII